MKSALTAKRKKHTSIWKWRSLCAASLLVVGLLSSLPSAEAATLIASWFRPSTLGATCGDTVWEIGFTVTGTTDDSGGLDYVGLTVTGPNGEPLWANSAGIGVGFTASTWAIVPGSFLINPITRRPLTVRVFDITSSFFIPNMLVRYHAIMGSGAPLLDQFIYDPATDVPACASLPYGSTPRCGMEPRYYMYTLEDANQPAGWQPYCYVISSNGPPSVESQARVCSVPGFDHVFRATNQPFAGWVYADCMGNASYGWPHWDPAWYRPGYTR